MRDGAHDGLPHRVRWDEIQLGDCIIALRTEKLPQNGAEVLRVLQFWDVLEQQDEATFAVYINSVVGLSVEGEAVTDRRLFAQGLPDTRH